MTMSEVLYLPPKILGEDCALKTMSLVLPSQLSEQELLKEVCLIDRVTGSPFTTE